MLTTITLLPFSEQNSAERHRFRLHPTPRLYYSTKEAGTVVQDYFVLVYFGHLLPVNPILKLNDYKSRFCSRRARRTTVERFPSVFGSFGNRGEQLLFVRADLSPSPEQKLTIEHPSRAEHTENEAEERLNKLRPHSNCWEPCVGR